MVGAAGALGSALEAGRPAARPPYSVLNNRGLRELGIDVMAGWREALQHHLSPQAR